MIRPRVCAVVDPHRHELSKVQGIDLCIPLRKGLQLCQIILPVIFKGIEKEYELLFITDTHGVIRDGEAEEAVAAYAQERYSQFCNGEGMDSQAQQPAARSSISAARAPERYQEGSGPAHRRDLCG